MGSTGVNYFDWGQVEWIYEPDAANSFNMMSIGIYTILPGKKQEMHIHYGDEQLLYVLSGRGRQLIGENMTLKETGSLFHIEAGSSHETVNIGDEPLRELVISIPANFENNLALESKQGSLVFHNKNRVPLSEISNEIERICESFAKSLKVPISIYDREGKLLIGGNGFPVICETKCNISESLNNCCLYGIQESNNEPQYKEPTVFICPHRLSVIIISIICNNEVVGIIKGGHVMISTYEKELKDSHYNLIGCDDSGQFYSKASFNAILQQFKKMRGYIGNYYVMKDNEIELGEKEDIIKDISKHEVILEESLKTTQEKVLNIQINNHFLFNTLNAIASLAVKENALNTYESVINLSNMFRYTLKTDSAFVMLKDELEHLSNYVELQKLRYGSKLKVKNDIRKDIKSVIIPFNCLQPILENCFIHGFKNKNSELVIKLSGKIEGGHAVIEIHDNGSGMNDEYVRELNKKIREYHMQETPCGLVMIYSKLRMFYKDRFDFLISSSIGIGTTVRIVLPLLEGLL
jgi:Putative regulator of cell autolysis